VKILNELEPFVGANPTLPIWISLRYTQSSVRNTNK